MNSRHSFSNTIRKTPRWLRLCLSFVPALLLMAMIFGFSSQNADASSSESILVTRQLLSALRDQLGLSWTPAELLLYADRCEFFVRKLAHFSEYALLGISLILPIRANFRDRLSSRASFGISLCISAAYAASDEFHQSFVPGRSPQVRDVLIDSAGALTGILLVLLVLSLRRRFLSRRAGRK